MAGLFARAVATKKETAPTKVKKQTAWLVGDPTGDAVAKSVHELVRLEAESKAIEARMGVHKTVVKNYAETNWLRDYATLGVPPETPLVVQNADGEKVTYVVQDRSGQYKVKDDQQEQLVDLLGQDAAQNLLYTETSFGFNRDLMAVPGVSEIVEKALEAAVKKLTTPGDTGRPVLTPEQAELLLDVSQKTSFKPGTLGQLVQICGRDAVRLKQFIDIGGSSFTRYIKS